MLDFIYSYMSDTGLIFSFDGEPPPQWADGPHLPSAIFLFDGSICPSQGSFGIGQSPSIGLKIRFAASLAREGRNGCVGRRGICGCNIRRVSRCTWKAYHVGLLPGSRIGNGAWQRLASSHVGYACYLFSQRKQARNSGNRRPYYRDWERT